MGAFQKYEDMLVYRCQMEHTTLQPQMAEPAQVLQCPICRPVIEVQRRRGQTVTNDGMMRLQPGVRRVKSIRRMGVAGTVGTSREFID